MRLLIRDETPADYDAIHELTSLAFTPMPFSNGTEAGIIRALRTDGDLTASLVAEEGDQIVGHVALSPLMINGVHDGWFGLGPISVRPDRQRRGIGKSLIAECLKRLNERDASGCALIGDPAIYSRAGFASDGHLTYRDLDRNYVQRIVLQGPSPQGALAFARAFER